MRLIDLLLAVLLYFLAAFVLFWSVLEKRIDLLTLAGVIYLVAENIMRKGGDT